MTTAIQRGDIVLFRRSPLNILWSYLRFGLKYNHMAIAIGNGNLMDIVADNPPRVKRLESLDSKDVTVFRLLPARELPGSLDIEAIQKNYTLGKNRLIFPWIKYRGTNNILCHEFVAQMYNIMADYEIGWVNVLDRLYKIAKNVDRAVQQGECYIVYRKGST